MMIDTITGLQIQYASAENYIDSLVNKFFKILPMREESEKSLREYIISFQREMIGFGNMVPSVGEDRLFVSMLSILQFFADNVDDETLTVHDVRSEVFHAISMCNKLKGKLSKGGDA